MIHGSFDYGKEFAKRIKLQGWNFSHVVQCYDGHDELVYSHDDYRGLVWHRDCCGCWEMVRAIPMPKKSYYLSYWEKTI